MLLLLSPINHLRYAASGFPLMLFSASPLVRLEYSIGYNLLQAPLTANYPVYFSDIRKIVYNLFFNLYNCPEGRMIHGKDVI